MIRQFRDRVVIDTVPGTIFHPLPISQRTQVGARCIYPVARVPSDVYTISQRRFQNDYRGVQYLPTWRNRRWRRARERSRPTLPCSVGNVGMQEFGESGNVLRSVLIGKKNRTKFCRFFSFRFLPDFPDFFSAHMRVLSGTIFPRLFKFTKLWQTSPSISRNSSD